MYSLSSESSQAKSIVQAVAAAPREIELKLRIPPGAAAAVRRAVATRGAREERLRARYFDTEDRRLAASGIALRLRKEDQVWVQTLKSRGDGLMQRGEHEVALGRKRGTPALDLARHDGTAAGAALRDALGSPPAELRETFATDIRRTARRVRAPGGVLVELALDEGEIRAGGALLPVHELELELLRGPAAALPALATKWVQRHGLWLDPRSKAERGERLARGVDRAPPVHASAPVLHAAMNGAQALRAIMASAMTQALSNACEIADGAGDADHLHQCRVGLRRLRCALRDFAPLAGDAAPAGIEAWEQQLRELLVELGRARDRDVLAAWLLPAMRAAGAELAALPPDEADPADPPALLRSPAVNVLWLELLASLHADTSPADANARSLRRPVRAVLARLHRQVTRDAARFEGLEEAMQHRIRKRLKRLRYGSEFCAALFPDAPVAEYLQALRPAQDALGIAQDLAVARALFAPQAQRDPRAAFVLGWVAARRPQVVAECGKALAAIAQAPRFWRA